PTEFLPQRGALYKNLGGARVAEATRAFGLEGAAGNGLGVAFGDPNDAGFPGPYLANDMLPCDLYINEHGRPCVNRGFESGTALKVAGSTQAGMGADFGDHAQGGREDLVGSNYQDEPTSLYHNEGEGSFTNAALSSHLGQATLATVGWGVKWAD